MHSQRRAESPVYASRLCEALTKWIGGKGGQRGVEEGGKREKKSRTSPIEGNRSQVGLSTEFDEAGVRKGILERLRRRRRERNAL